MRKSEFSLRVFFSREKRLSLNTSCEYIHTFKSFTLYRNDFFCRYEIEHLLKSWGYEDEWIVKREVALSEKVVNK